MGGLKAAIIGAGSTYTPELIEGLINRKDTLPLREIAMMDIDSRKLGIVGALAQRMVGHAGLPCAAVLTEDLDRALDGADFVFAQIRVGRLPARVLDEKIPLKHGLIGQETSGIGGFFKALRTVPVLLGIGRRMESLCPDAWMINFSNPSGICAQAMLAHGKTKMLGLCNAPLGMRTWPAKALGLDPAAVEVDYVGLNHLSFVTAMRCGGRDYLREALDGDGALLGKLADDEGERAAIRLCGGLPNYYNNYYMRPRASLEKLRAAKQSRGERCMEIEEELLAMYSDTGLYVKPKQLEQRGGAMYSEVAVSLAESIRTDDNAVHVVNALNNGSLPFMADDDVVETSAHVGKGGARTIPVKSAGNAYAQGLIRVMKAYERHTVSAALTGGKDDAIRALMLNPLVTDMDAAIACFDELLEAHRQYLPAFCA